VGPTLARGGIAQIYIFIKKVGKPTPKALNIDYVLGSFRPINRLQDAGQSAQQMPESPTSK
jgi:hypothetical protein